MWFHLHVFSFNALKFEWDICFFVEISVVMKKLHETFITLAARMHETHEAFKVKTLMVVLLPCDASHRVYGKIHTQCCRPDFLKGNGDNFFVCLIVKKVEIVNKTFLNLFHTALSCYPPPCFIIIDHMSYYKNDQKFFKTQNNFYQVVTSRISGDRYEYPRWRNA